MQEPSLEQTCSTYDLAKSKRASDPFRDPWIISMGIASVIIGGIALFTSVYISYFYSPAANMQPATLELLNQEVQKPTLVETPYQGK